MKKQFSFYKKKSFYIVLIVIFSLILVADLAIGLLLPSRSMGNISQMQGSGSGSGFPGMGFGGGMDFGDMELPDGMEFPGGMDFGDMQMPDGMEFPDGMTRPGGSNFPSMGNGTESGGGFLQTIKANWVLIFVVFALLDAASIYMLVRISRQEKKERKVDIVHDELEDILTLVDEKTSSGRGLTYAGIAIGLVGVILLVTIVNGFNTGTQTVARTEATIHSGTASLGQLNSIVPGTGTLQDETGETIEIVVGVEATDWFVSNGDIVEAGDKIALIDRVSVMTQIEEVQELLDSLDQKLADSIDDKLSETIFAAAEGRVKEIYVQEGTSLAETMYQYGALMLISLDGMMAVDLQTDADILTGDIVTVITETGEEHVGRVHSYLKGTAVITVSDKTFDKDEKVTVKTENGDLLGAGELYIHSELKVMGFAGVAEDIKVSKNKLVDSGAMLVELEDTEYTGEYESLLAQRHELEIVMQELIKLYQEEYIYASCDGVVSNLSTDTVTTGASQSVTTATGSTGMTGNSGISGNNGMTGGIQQNYTVSKSTWLLIVPQQQMTINVTIDEMDILLIQEGQSVQITLDALPGQSFDGVVSALDYNGTNSGGSTKYTVTVGMERQENMLAGMNASVSIATDSKENLLMIPLSALVETEEGVYVYTTYDEKTQELGGLVEVTTGLADGEQVEILTGLSEGDTYWYSYLDTVNYESYFVTSGGGGISFPSMMGGGSFGGGMGGNRGGR